ncbi:major capsid protein [Rickettsia endosymbiont of Cardiosporidium cionae]|uniref:major capsid protein n=1 Tax=Rickettsia endosymbiont of Cardiosporidium cionae TaxID=2777155 RepID=UPI001896047D|nr:major capsid protein [Rickettsia endosymbiont of Cardiosporidium cionae]KAF8818074.1 hypothetical protein IHI24_000873 [Rickettsia endosymbiont of Cardiosporidium cionae]
MNIFDTTTLATAVAYLKRPSFFLLDTFFAAQEIQDSETITFDVLKGSERLAPLVDPDIAAKVLENPGFQTFQISPAYVKDLRLFSPERAGKRVAGERVGGEFTRQNRLELAINQALTDQLANLKRREEYFASQALINGKITIKGTDSHRGKSINFGRDSALNISLSGTNSWGSTGVNPLEMIEDWVSLVQDKSGTAARTIVMDRKAWKLFRQSQLVVGLLEIRRGTTNSLSAEPVTFEEGEGQAQYVGSIADMNFYVYAGKYSDEGGVSRGFLPDNTVLVVSREGLRGTRIYGAIEDISSGLQARDFYVKSWEEHDPSRHMMLMQSAPMIVPMRPNASLAATVV